MGDNTTRPDTPLTNTQNSNAGHDAASPLYGNAHSTYAAYQLPPMLGNGVCSSAYVCIEPQSKDPATGGEKVDPARRAWFEHQGLHSDTPHCKADKPKDPKKSKTPKKP